MDVLQDCHKNAFQAQPCNNGYDLYSCTVSGAGLKVSAVFTSHDVTAWTDNAFIYTHLGALVKKAKNKVFKQMDYT